MISIQNNWYLDSGFVQKQFCYICHTNNDKHLHEIYRKQMVVHMVSTGFNNTTSQMILGFESLS